MLLHSLFLPIRRYYLFSLSTATVPILFGCKAILTITYTHDIRATFGFPPNMIMQLFKHNAKQITKAHTRHSSNAWLPVDVKTFLLVDFFNDVIDTDFGDIHIVDCGVR